MTEAVSGNRAWWLVVGILGGLGLATFWPHERAFAVATDRDEQFAITTCNVGLIDPIEAVFVLDFLTSTIKGAVLNRQVGKFTAFYYRELAADFQIDEKKQPRYAMVTGQATLVASGQVTFAPSVIYIAELNSGQMRCYAFAWRDTPVVTRPGPLLPIDAFMFREPSE